MLGLKNSKSIAGFSYALFVLMLAGLLWSRAILSISCGLWIVLVAAQWRNYKIAFREPMVLWGFAPIALFVLGMWQQPTATANYDYLLTILLYPVAAMAAATLSMFTNERLKTLWIVIGLASLLYPIGWYLLHISEATTMYGQGRSLPTFMDGDHVRYGLFLDSILLLVIYTTSISRRWKITIILLLLFIILLMAVRTAWVGMFIILLFAAFAKHDLRSFFRKLWIVFIPLSIAAYFVIPTVRQKVNYTMYDYHSFNSSNYDSNFSDGARRVINRIAWQTIQEDKLAAVGWAGISAALQQGFTKRYPRQQLSYGWPFNQWLFWWMGSGLLGMILFTTWLLFPVYYGWKKNNSAIACWTLVIAASCLVESTLSLQYGVFLHVWPLMLLWKMNEDKVTTH
jgi:O-antigen ligase